MSLISGMLEDLVIWTNFDAYPSKEVLEKHIICLEYLPEKHEDLLAWIEAVQDIVIKDDVDFDSIMVFADCDRYSAVEVAKLVKVFDEAGALFTKLPDNTELDKPHKSR